MRNPILPLCLFALFLIAPCGVRAQIQIGTVTVGARLDVQNITGRRFVYNFGNPFSGTRFGHPRLWSGRIRFVSR
jgi:hypothetical protein